LPRLEPGAALLSLVQAALLCDCSERTIYNLLKSGELEDVRIGIRRYVTRDSIEAYLARRNAAPVESAS
jgi:excisionase family DNA binding protein